MISSTLPLRAGSILSVAGIALLAAVSYAGTYPGDALRAFGLIGSWSRNCALPVGSLGSSRITYDAPRNGRATVTTSSTVLILGGHQVQAGSVFEIEDAKLLSERQIALVGKTTKIDCPGCNNPSKPDISLRQIIIEKTGTQIHMVVNRLLDGTSTAIEAGVIRGTGQLSPFDNKCADQSN